MTARRSALRAGGPALLAGYSWAVGEVRTFTWPAAVLTFLPGAAVMVLAARDRRPRRRTREWWAEQWPPRPGPLRTAALAWALLLGLLAGWELVALFWLPRSAHPTLSSVSDAALHSHPARAAAFAGWVLLGRALVRR